MLQAHDSAILGMAFSKSQRYIATASDDCTVRVWDVGKRVAVAKLVGHNDLVECAAFHPLNEQLLASGSLDQTIRVWNRATLKEIATLRGHKGRIFSLAFSSDGQSLVSGSADGTAKVWETTGWKERTTLSVGHWVTSCAFGQLSQKVVLGLGTGLVEFWDISTGSRVLTLIGHQFAVNSLAFSPDGMTLASGSHDETVKLWQIPLE